MNLVSEILVSMIDIETYAAQSNIEIITRTIEAQKVLINEMRNARAIRN